MENNKPKLVDILDSIRGRFVSDVNMVGILVHKTVGSLQRRKKLKPRAPRFGKEDKPDLERLAQFFKEAEQKMETQPAGQLSVTIKSEKVGRFLMSIIEKAVFPDTHTRFLLEMSLVYLISFQEAFVKDYLKAIFMHRHTMLKSGKTITFNEALSFDSLESLIDGLAEKEVNVISYMNIDEVATYFRDRLSVMLPEDFSGWTALREASYRRNLIIHNKGTTNDVYCSKTGYAKKGEKLKTDAKYVENVAKVIVDFIHFIHAKLIDKLKLQQTTDTNI